MDIRELISDELDRLAHQRASGALVISGAQAATVFLSGGYLTYAESPGVPDLRSRLVSSQRLSSARWGQVRESARAYGSIGGFLVGSGIITDSELRDLLWSITVDALIALALPSPTGPLTAAAPSIAEVRFWPRTSHLIGLYLNVDLASAWEAARRKAELLAQGQALAGTCPLLTEPRRPWAVVTREQWTLAWQIDGRATVKDLAWRNGFALCDTMEWVEDLIRAGLCAIGPDVERPGEVGAEGRDMPENASREPEPRAGDLRTGAGPLPEPDEGEAAALPHRNPGAALAAARSASRSGKARPPAVPQWRAADIKKPPETSHSDLLHRILRGLRGTDRG